MSSVVVTTGSRLHFGLLGFGHPLRRNWGGVGVMIERPATVVRVSPAAQLEAAGPGAERALGAARHWSRAGGTCREIGARIEIVEAAPAHVGFGSGTQLALAVGRALDELQGRTSEIGDLAIRVGRTGRSSVGTLGFAHGGLIHDLGKRSTDHVGPIGTRLQLPADWRWILVRPRHMAGISGAAEKRVFSELPPSDPQITARLESLAARQFGAALRRGDLAAFGAALSEYNRLAGSWFAALQGGIYLNAEVAALIERLEKGGGIGVGQTSWGPTVFAIAADEPAARRLLASAGLAEDPEFESHIVATLQRGAAVSKEL